MCLMSTRSKEGKAMKSGKSKIQGKGREYTERGKFNLKEVQVCPIENVLLEGCEGGDVSHLLCKTWL